MARISMGRLLAICVLLISAASPVQMQRGGQDSTACSVRGASELHGTPLAGNLGQPIDKALWRDGIELSKLFEIYPAIFYMQEDFDPDAQAIPKVFPLLLQKEGRNVSCCPDGTVLIGLELIKSEWRATRGTGLSIPAILAHEYAHIAQIKYNFPSQKTKWRELHADFLAGWYIAHRYRYMVTSPDQAMKNFYYKGDYEFNNPNHHGTPKERGDAFHAGFEFNRSSNIISGALAYRAGIEYLNRHGARIPR